MDHQVTQDATGTHLDWRHDGVTARMIDWFWSNMEKGFVLWHPTEHEPLTWVVAPQDGDPVGSVHLAPQTWSDGTFQNLYIRFEDPTEVPGPIAQLVTHAHCVIVAGLGFGPESLDEPDPMGYRVHQWSPTDSGVAGRSSAIGARKPETTAGRARLGQALRRGDRQLGRLPPAALRAVQGGPARARATRSPTSASSGGAGASATDDHDPQPRPPRRVDDDPEATVRGQLLRAAHHDPVVPDPALHVHAGRPRGVRDVAADLEALRPEAPHVLHDRVLARPRPRPRRGHDLRQAPPPTPATTRSPARRAGCRSPATGRTRGRWRSRRPARTRRPAGRRCRPGRHRR